VLITFQHYHVTQRLYGHNSVGSKTKSIRPRAKIKTEAALRLAFGRRAFSVAGPTVWNSLPTEFRSLSVSFGDFRRARLRRYYSRDISALSAIEMLCILLRYINFSFYSILVIRPWSQTPRLVSIDQNDRASRQVSLFVDSWIIHNIIVVYINKQL